MNNGCLNSIAHFLSCIYKFVPEISRVVSLHMLEAGETRDSNSYISKMKRLIFKREGASKEYVLCGLHNYTYGVLPYCQ